MLGEHTEPVLSEAVSRVREESDACRPVHPPASTWTTSPRSSRHRRARAEIRTSARHRLSTDGDGRM